MTNHRHDRRDDAGRYRPRTEAEAHGAFMAALIRNQQARKHAHLATLHPSAAWQPLDGLVPRAR